VGYPGQSLDSEDAALTDLNIMIGELERC